MDLRAGCDEGLGPGFGCDEGLGDPILSDGGFGDLGNVWGLPFDNAWAAWPAWGLPLGFACVGLFSF